MHSAPRVFFKKGEKLLAKQTLFYSFSINQMKTLPTLSLLAIGIFVFGGGIMYF
jgi:hypothetical protein